MSRFGEENKMKAKMRDNLVPRYISLSPDVVDFPDEEIQRFLTAIENTEVDLVFVGQSQDAFEKENGNIWLPDCLWDEL